MFFIVKSNEDCLQIQQVKSNTSHSFCVSSEVIGVAELVNKTNGPWFNRFDEDLATAFSIYCGISIAHVREIHT